MLKIKQKRDKIISGLFFSNEKIETYKMSKNKLNDIPKYLIVLFETTLLKEKTSNIYKISNTKPLPLQIHHK